MNKVIDEIYKQGKDYKKHTNEWNVMQQLVDIIAAQPKCAEIVEQDLKIKEMDLAHLVKQITGKRMSDPIEVMKAICKFYSIDCPDELPPEHWRTNNGQSSGTVSLIDML